MENIVKIEKLNILLVEDCETDAYSIRRALSKHMKHPCCVRHVERMADAKTVLEAEHNIDLILLDLGLPDTEGGEDTYKGIENIADQVPVIILTSVHDYELAIGMIGKGAENYIRKASVSVDPEALCDAIDFAVCRHHNVETLRDENRKELEEKDQVIGWMTGGYSVDRTPR